jgi:hypothetical protein
MAYTKSVTKKSGFEWINESKTDRPKWGFVATQVGSYFLALQDPFGYCGG